MPPRRKVTDEDIKRAVQILIARKGLERKEPAPSVPNTSEPCRASSPITLSKSPSSSSPLTFRETPRSSSPVKPREAPSTSSPIESAFITSADLWGTAGERKGGSALEYHPVDDDEFLAQLDCHEITREEFERFFTHVLSCSYCLREFVFLVQEGVIFSRDRAVVPEIRTGKRLKQWVAIAVAVCMLIGIVLLWGMIPGELSSSPARLLARAERAVQAGKIDVALTELERFLSDKGNTLRETNPELLGKLQGLFEESAYRKASSGLARSDFSEVVDAEGRLRKVGLESPRVMNLVLQAQRGFRSELALEEAGTLAHLGYELDGAWLYKSSEFDTTAKRLYQEYQVLLERYPHDLRLLLNFAHFCLVHSSLEEAKAAFQKVLDLEPGNVHALIGMGLVEFELRNLEKAADYFRQAMAADPSSETAKINLAICLEAQQRKEEARKLWEELLASCQDPNLKSRIANHLHH